MRSGPMKDYSVVTLRFTREGEDWTAERLELGTARCSPMPEGVDLDNVNEFIAMFITVLDRR